MAKTEHVAFYLPSLHGGGAERVMVLLANGFASRGYRVDLVLADADGPYLSEVSGDVRVINLNTKRVFKSLMPLVRYIRNEKPGAIISAMAHANIISIVAKYISGIGVRSIVSEHTSILYDDRKSYLSNLIRKIIYKKADKIICVSKGLQEIIRREVKGAGDKVCVIYNPLDLELIVKKSECVPHHAWIGAADSELIVAVGRLSREKDYETLLRAFRIVRNERNVRLAVLGDGPERDNLRALSDGLEISGDVHFAGFQSNPYGWLSACDLYVMSSVSEGLPGALLEAMACGARIVSTDCPTGPDEILESGKWGRLVPVGDAARLAGAIVAALDDSSPPDTRLRATDFRIDYAIDKYIEVVEGHRDATAFTTPDVPEPGMNME